MNPLPAAQLLAQQNWRYATKQFDPARKISAADWSALEDCLVLSPSSFGLQPWKFIVVNDPATRAKLLPHSWGQRQIVDASHLVVFAAKPDIGEAEIDALLQRTVDLRGGSLAALAGYRGMMVGSLVKGRDAAARRQWAGNQVYIALGNFLTSAALLGLDACPMEGIEPAKYDEVLGLGAQGLATVVAATVGYRAAGDKYATLAKVRFPKADLIATV